MMEEATQDNSPPRTPLQEHMLEPLKRVHGMLLLIGTALLGLALSACGSTWEKPGMSAESWEKDKFECELQGRQAAAGSSASGIFMQEYDAARFRDRCLALRGYTRK